jgi:hypothetical protein
VLATNSVPNCAAGNYPDVTNSPPAEQRKVVLRKVETICAYMNQTTFLVRGSCGACYIYTMNQQVAGLQ